jgi:hypothetical protein
MGIWAMCMRITGDELRYLQEDYGSEPAQSYWERLRHDDADHLWMDRGQFLVSEALDAPVVPEKRPVFDPWESGTPLVHLQATYGSPRYLRPDEVQSIVQLLRESGWDAIPDPPSPTIPYIDETIARWPACVAHCKALIHVLQCAAEQGDVIMLWLS